MDSSTLATFYNKTSRASFRAHKCVPRIHIWGGLFLGLGCCQGLLPCGAESPLRLEDVMKSQCSREVQSSAGMLGRSLEVKSKGGFLRIQRWNVGERTSEKTPGTRKVIERSGGIHAYYKMMLEIKKTKPEETRFNFFTCYCNSFSIGLTK